MLMEISCPTCGGPASHLEGGISCPLCGNQGVVPVPSVTLPSTIEFELSGEADPESWSESELTLAVEYLLGFVEAYEGLPEVAAPAGGARLFYTPPPAQLGELGELCRRYSVSPEVALQAAVAVYAARER